MSTWLPLNVVHINCWGINVLSLRFIEGGFSWHIFKWMIKNLLICQQRIMEKYTVDKTDVWMGTFLQDV